MIPFTTAEFLRVFEQYNNAVWPGHVLIYLVALIAIVLAFMRSRTAGKLISLILAVLWSWMGVCLSLDVLQQNQRRSPIVRCAIYRSITDLRLRRCLQFKVVFQI